MDLNSLSIAVSIFSIVIAIAVPIWVYFREKKYKKISYSIITSTPLISVKSEIKNRIKIHFDKKLVQDLTLLIVRVFNDGNVPVTSSDYEAPLTLKFKKSTRVLEAEITQTKPHNLPVSISTRANEIIIQPVLLNSGNSLTIKLLLTDADHQVSLSGHVVGVDEINEVQYTNSVSGMESARNKITTAVIGLMVITGSHAVLTLTQNFLGLESITTAGPGMMNGLISFVMVIASVLVFFYMIWGGFEWILSSGLTE